MNTEHTVAIVGRPNVGKSALFNALAGRDISLVFDRPGTTRDRLVTSAKWGGHRITLIVLPQKAFRVMTKSWEDIREDVCRLYRDERKPLNRIQQLMLEKKGFKAWYDLPLR